MGLTGREGGHTQELRRALEPPCPPPPAAASRAPSTSSSPGFPRPSPAPTASSWWSCSRRGRARWRRWPGWPT